MIAFGPVPSRRLGKSLGINNIPFKYCSYSCAYCQLGITRNLIIERRKFYEPEEVFSSVLDKVSEVRNVGGEIDYLTFVPDGEPTLDENLGVAIKMIKQFKIPIAVITNGSLLSLESVANDLGFADLVSVKVDTVDEKTFLKLNRPYYNLQLKSILEGIRNFSKFFKGKLITETMLVKGINDSTETIDETAKFIKGINPFEAYIAIPIRPPQDQTIAPPKEEKLVAAFQIFSNYLRNVSLLSEAEEGSFSSTGDISDDILSITSVHPMRQEKVIDLVKSRGGTIEIIESLVNDAKLKEVDYNGEIFYIRNFANGGNNGK